MSISWENNIVIGAGKLAWSFVSALHAIGYAPKHIMSKNIESAKQIADASGILSHTDNLFSALETKPDVVFLSIPDHQIEIVTSQIVTKREYLKGALIVHFSGAHSITELQHVREAGMKTASIHLMQSFPNKKVISLKNTYAAIEANDEEIAEDVMRFAKLLELHPFRIDPHQKVFYHLAGVFASNFMIANMFSAEKVFNASVANEVIFIDVAQTITKKTVDNIFEYGIQGALSGPVKRGDYPTIKHHITSIRKSIENDSTKHRQMNLLLLTYVVQSLTLLEVIGNENHSNDQQKIRMYLENELKQICSVLVENK